MTIEEERSQNGKGKKRNPFRRKPSDGSGEDGSEAGSTTNRSTHSKLRWAQHLGQREHASIENDVKDSPRSHPWKVPPGKKLNWSPRLGHHNNKSHDGNNDEVDAASDGNKDPLNEHAKHTFGLHWSPRLGRKKKGGGETVDYNNASETGNSRDEDGICSAVDGETNSEASSSRNGDSGIPRMVGGTPVNNGEGGTKKKFMWHHRSAELSDSISDDISDGSSTKKETAGDRVQRIKRKLNPLANKKSQWRYNSVGEHRIDEEEEHLLPLGSELDPLAKFNPHSLAGDLAGDRETAEGHTAFARSGKKFSPNRRRSSTEPTITSADFDEIQFHRVQSLERNTSPRSLSPKSTQERGSYESNVIGLRGGNNGLRDSDVISLGASVGAVSGLLPEEGPVHTYRKGDKKAENKEFRVKPYRCFDPPMYMTEAEIHKFMLQPSENVAFLDSFIAPSTKRTKKIEVAGEMERIWGNTNDGRIGSLRVEVLGCVGLASYKPDVSTYLICGDVPFVTDVISSCRSPRWPPNCKRAAIFPVHHAYARLYAGVFASKKDKANDEFCGRVVVDLSSLRPNTEYDVTLPLRASSFIYDRRPRGVIRLRFSLHWFSERAAVWSYLKRPHSLAASPFGDNPSILCGDPKTFRNVAITVHGQDLPGKFTRKAFQATMREFNLTRLNLIFLAKTLAKEAVLYQNPLVSLYIFVTWMHCVYADSMKLAPAYFVGYLILCLFNNYETFNQDEERHLGFAPPTLQELLTAMVSRTEETSVRSIFVDKNAVSMRQRNKLFEKQYSGSTYSFSQDFSGDIQPLDHREFPFSEKLEYPRFRPEDAVAPTKQADLAASTSTDHYLYGRLTEFASEKMSSLQSALPTVTSGDDEDEWGISDNDEEIDMHDPDGIRDDEDNVFLESDDEDDDEGGISNAGAPMDLQRRIPIGPPQDCDVKPAKRVPPQVMLARAENTLHSLTFGLSCDKLFHSSLAVGKRLSGGAVPSPESSTRDLPDVDARSSRRKKRSLLDDFDKRLGLRTRSKNPVVGITSSFLGPIMRMFRIFLVATRVVFNIGIWKDPFLSFWVLCFLVALMLILLVFPWRTFMFMSGLVCFGPQNILVRRRLLRQAADAEKEQLQTDTETVQTGEDSNTGTEPSDESPSIDSRASATDGTPRSLTETTAPDASTEDDAAEKKQSRRRRLKKKIASMREKRRSKKQESLRSEPEPPPMPTRPVFSGATYHKASKVPLEPREVVVPYTRVRTERFYDWPPDPTVSRAAPVSLADYGIIEETFLPSPSEGSITPPSITRRRFSKEQ